MLDKAIELCQAGMLTELEKMITENPSLLHATNEVIVQHFHRNVLF